MRAPRAPAGAKEPAAASSAYDPSSHAILATRPIRYSPFIIRYSPPPSLAPCPQAVEKLLVFVSATGQNALGLIDVGRDSINARIVAMQLIIPFPFVLALVLSVPSLAAVFIGSDIASRNVLLQFLAVNTFICMALFFSRRLTDSRTVVAVWLGRLFQAGLFMICLGTAWLTAALCLGNVVASPGSFGSIGAVLSLGGELTLLGFLKLLPLTTRTRHD